MLHALLCHVTKGHVVTVEASEGEYTPLWLLLVCKEGTLSLCSEVSKNCLLEIFILGHSLLINGYLHPAGCQYASLCVIISIPTPLQRLPPVHRPRSESDPSLVLRDHSDHAGLVHLCCLHLVPWVLHQPQIVRDLALVGGFLDRVLGEDLMNFLEVLMLVLARVHDLFRYEFPLLPFSCGRGPPLLLISAGQEIIGVYKSSSLDEVRVGRLGPRALYVLLLSHDPVKLNAVQGEIQSSTFG